MTDSEKLAPPEIDDDAIDAAAERVRRGECVAFPTETVYGLGADATNATAVAQIFAIKDRPSFDPLIVHLAGTDELDEVARDIPDRARALADAHWPGPLTLVLPKASTIPDIVTAGLPSVGVRVPDHPVARALIRRAGCPLAAPSANPFGYVSPTSATHVREQLGHRVETILDGGPCRVGVESTIISFVDAQPALLRAGGIDLETLEKFLGKVQIRTSATVPSAPGQLPQHYAPRTRVELVKAPSDVAAADRPTAALLTMQPVEDIDGFATARSLSPDGDLRVAAAALFAALRELDGAPVATIYAIPPAEVGIGRAITDRLRRASAE